MVQEKPAFPSKLLHLSLLVFLLTILDNGVQCFRGKKVLSMHKFQWKQESDSSSCLSQKSSEYSEVKREGLLNLFICSPLSG